MAYYPLTNIEQLFDTGGMRAGAAKSTETRHLEVVRQAVTTAATLAHQRTLPVAEGLTALVPSGCLQRGNVLSTHGVGATSLGLALVGEAARSGSFLAIIAPHSFSLASCLDFDIPLRRVVQFVLPSGGSSNSLWAQSVAAVVEGFDLVLLLDRHRVSSSQARQLTARNRERGSIIVRVGGPDWPDAADLRFETSSPDWSGLGQGHGHLRARQVSVQVAGRRYHGGSRAHSILLPAVGGGVETALPEVAQVERFAGSDVDEMLSAVDGSDAEGSDVAAGLDAIA